MKMVTNSDCNVVKKSHLVTEAVGGFIWVHRHVQYITGPRRAQWHCFWSAQAWGARSSETGGRGRRGRDTATVFKLSMRVWTYDAIDIPVYTPQHTVIYVASLPSHTLHRQRKGLVMLQLRKKDCHNDRKLRWLIKSILFVDWIHYHGKGIVSYSGALRTGSMAFEATLWQNLDQLYAKWRSLT